MLKMIRERKDGRIYKRKGEKKGVRNEREQKNIV